MGTDPETVDYSIVETPPGGDDEEYETSRNFVYLVRACHNVRSMNDAYVKILKDKDWTKSWSSHPLLKALNPNFPTWLDNLPPEMQISYSEDGSPPWLRNHFVGNVHCYYHLGILILHRPQLMASSFTGSSWKEHMQVCYQSAKMLCRIQEALLRDFGINGLLCMQRGNWAGHLSWAKLTNLN